MIEFKTHDEMIAYLKQYTQRIELALIRELEYAVSELQNHARNSAGYTDRTSNLKSSIGGTVLKNGKPIKYSGFEGADEGGKSGIEFLNSLIQEYTKGYVIIIVAGMNYATFVENKYSKNVLKLTELKMRRDIPSLIENLKRKL